MLLALETSTNVCSVALLHRNGKVYEKRTGQRGSHSEQLFLFIEGLMEEHDFSITDLAGVLVSEGPGSYTGLRISASAVKGLLFQTDVPLYAVETLAGFAQAAIETHSSTGTIHAVIDARRVHLYHQQFAFKNNEMDAVTELGVRPIEEVQTLLEPGDTIMGTGTDRLEENFLKGITRLGSQYISAKSLLSLYQEERNKFYRRVDPEQFDPKYYTSRQANS